MEMDAKDESNGLRNGWYGWSARGLTANVMMVGKLLQFHVVSVALDQTDVFAG